MHEGGTAERPALFFDDAADFRLWLQENHETAPELWMGYYKKHIGRGLKWQEAVREALCFGWIDSVSQRIDADRSRQRWTPRRKGSIWSSINIAHVADLTTEGKMQAAGLAAFALRSEDRSAIYAYEVEVEEFSNKEITELSADESVLSFWNTATASYRKHATHWVTSAKLAQTRVKRFTVLLESCRAGELIPSQRYGKEPAWVAKAKAARSKD